MIHAKLMKQRTANYTASQRDCSLLEKQMRTCEDIGNREFAVSERPPSYADFVQALTTSGMNVGALRASRETEIMLTDVFSRLKAVTAQQPKTKREALFDALVAHPESMAAQSSVKRCQSSASGKAKQSKIDAISRMESVSAFGRQVKPYAPTLSWEHEHSSHNFSGGGLGYESPDSLDGRAATVHFPKKSQKEKSASKVSPPSARPCSGFVALAIQPSFMENAGRLLQNPSAYEFVAASYPQFPWQDFITAAESNTGPFLASCSPYGFAPITQVNQGSGDERVSSLVDNMFKDIALDSENRTAEISGSTEVQAILDDAIGNESNPILAQGCAALLKLSVQEKAANVKASLVASHWPNILLKNDLVPSDRDLLMTVGVLSQTVENTAFFSDKIPTKSSGKCVFVRLNVHADTLVPLISSHEDGTPQKPFSVPGGTSASFSESKRDPSNDDGHGDSGSDTGSGIDTSGGCESSTSGSESTGSGSTGSGSGSISGDTSGSDTSSSSSSSDTSDSDINDSDMGDNEIEAGFVDNAHNSAESASTESALPTTFTAAGIMMPPLKTKRLRVPSLKKLEANQSKF